MHTYLVVCGIIFNVLVLSIIIYGTIDGVRVRKINKRNALEVAQKQVQYKGGP